MPLAFLCHRDVLAPLVEAASKAVRKSKIPVLGNLLVTADETGRLSIMGTDLALAITAFGYAEEVSEAGAVSIDAATFQASVKRMPDGPVRVAVDDQTMTIRGGRASARIHILPATDHPSITGGAPTHEFVLGSGDLKRMADRCGFAMRDDSDRFYLAGIHWHEDPDNVRLVAVATDGKVLSKIHFERPEGAAGMPAIIVPIDMVQKWSAITGKKDTPVRVALSDAHLTLATPELSITSKLVDGTYPAYARLFPRANPLHVTVQAADLADALERMMIYAPNQENAYRDVKCTFGDGALKLFTRSDIGEASDEIAIDDDSDAEIVIGFNARQLLDTVKAIESARIVLALADAGAPAMLTSEDEPDHEMVAMPIRLKW
ncbi:DNA polymerase III subunit beta [Jiella pelagia]|uniref:Beta sliding clamp n=1 Tax=Jiella pelagia TaxID=2986949 RepID=A0ABY7BVV8_9HYPH|nr:DNA polymerase III subunit beta [Jiella pelagia]WAP67200.1 DNA polymerase III subunit beta [Jiella pelagia]